MVPWLSKAAVMVWTDEAAPEVLVARMVPVLVRVPAVTVKKLSSPLLPESLSSRMVPWLSKPLAILRLALALVVTDSSKVPVAALV